MLIANYIGSDTMKKILVIPNQYKDKGFRITLKVVRWLKDKGYRVYLPDEFLSVFLFSENILLTFLIFFRLTITFFVIIFQIKK